MRIYFCFNASWFRNNVIGWPDQIFTLITSTRNWSFYYFWSGVNTWIQTNYLFWPTFKDKHCFCLNRWHVLIWCPTPILLRTLGLNKLFWILHLNIDCKGRTQIHILREFSKRWFQPSFIFSMSTDKISAPYNQALSCMQCRVTHKMVCLLMGKPIKVAFNVHHAPCNVIKVKVM